MVACQKQKACIKCRTYFISFMKRETTMEDDIKRYYFFIVLITSIFILTSASNPALAKTKKVHASANSRYASLVVDADTGTILHQENAGKLRYPASLTKMMTLYLTFEALERGDLQMNQQLPVSEHAASQPKMNLSLRAGEVLSVREAILSLIVRSANDAAVVLAEAVGSTEPTFAEMMTERAQQLGMKHTIFRNASGLPHIDQKTTAYDMARLAIALKRDFPQYYPFFSKTHFTFRGRELDGHNHVTRYYPGADGLKTGFVNASGFNLVTSASRGDVKLVGIVMGGKTAQSRDQKMISLLNQHFIKSGIKMELADNELAQALQEETIVKKPIKKSFKAKQVKSKKVTKSKKVQVASQSKKLKKDKKLSQAKNAHPSISATSSFNLSSR